jgi:hypothetical protein
MFLYHHNNSCCLQNIHHNSHLHNYFEKEALFVDPPDFLDFPDSLDLLDLPDLPDSPDFFALFV